MALSQNSTVAVSGKFILLKDIREFYHATENWGDDTIITVEGGDLKKIEATFGDVLR